jgi:hypothetical protein
MDGAGGVLVVEDDFAKIRVKITKNNQQRSSPPGEG